MGVNVATLRVETQGYDEAKRKTAELKAEQRDLARSSDMVSAADVKAEQARNRVAAARERMARQAEIDLRNSEMQRQALADYDRSLAGSAALRERAANDNVASLERESSAFRDAGKWAAQHPVLVIAGAALVSRALSSLAGSAGTALASASLATARYATTSTAMGGAVAGASVVASRGLGVASTAATAASGGLGVLSTALRGLTSPIGLVIAGGVLLSGVLSGLGSSSEGASKASDEVEKVTGRFEKLVALAKQAETLDVSGPFIKSFTGLGAKFNVEVDEMQAALQKGVGFVRDEFEQVNKLRAKMTELEKLGYSGGEPFKADEQLDLAKNNEERIRAAFTLMQELEDRGHKLAALSIGENFFPPSLLDRLRSGQLTIAQLVDAYNDLSGKQLMKQEDVARALELSRAIERTKQEIWALIDVRSDVSKLGIAVNEWYLSGLQAIKSVLDYIWQSIDALGKKFTESSFYQNAKWLLEKVGIATSLTAEPTKPTPLPTADTTVIGSRTFPEMQGPKLPDPSSLRQQKQAATEAVSAYDLLIKKTEDRIDELNLEADTLGRTSREVVKLKLNHDLERAALKSGTVVTAEMRDQWDKLGDRLADANDHLEESRRRLDAVRESQRELGSMFTDALDEMILKGGKFADVMKRASESFASNSIKALLTGEGPLAGLFGTQAVDRNSMGGIFGGQMNFAKMLGLDNLKVDVGAGAYQGITDALDPFLKPRTDASGKSMGFLSTPLGGGLAAAGAGAAIGYSSQSPLMGALGGGLSGALMGASMGKIGGLPGMAVGALIGAGSGLLGSSYGHKPSRKKDRDHERRQRVREFAACGHADGRKPVFG